jgi:hypothetical protein
MKKIKIQNSEKFILVDEEDFDYLNQWRWRINTNGYAVKGESISRNLMHRILLNDPINLQVDHRNGDKLDNRKENLRICTSSQNKMNVGIKSNNTSTYKGVSFDKFRNKYRACIMVNKKTISLGRFDSPIDAAHAYDEAAKKYFGEFAKLNFA